MVNARLLGELRHRTEEVAELNRGLEARVAEHVEELSHVGCLKHFSPAISRIHCRTAKRKSSKVIAAKSASYSAICAATHSIDTATAERSENRLP